MWADKRYHSLDYEMKARYGHKIYKIALDGGFTCPNRDGLIDTRGCIFCSAGGSGDFAASRQLSITDQIEEGCGLWMDCLQAKFDPDRLDLIKLREQIKNVF